MLCSLPCCTCTMSFLRCNDQDTGKWDTEPTGWNETSRATSASRACSPTLPRNTRYRRESLGAWPSLTPRLPRLFYGIVPSTSYEDNVRTYNDSLPAAKNADHESEFQPLCLAPCRASVWGLAMITGYVPRDGAKVCGNIVMQQVHNHHDDCAPPAQNDGP